MFRLRLRSLSYPSRRSALWVTTTTQNQSASTQVAAIQSTILWPVEQQRRSLFTPTSAQTLLAPRINLSSVHGQQSRQYSNLTSRPTEPGLCLASKTTVMSAKKRSIAVQAITKNLQLITDRPHDVTHDPKSLRLNKQRDRPLVIMLAWLLAKKKPLLKYAEIYVEQGFDVITITISPWQLLWPVKGSHVVTADVVRFLESNHGFNPMLIHGFSVGAYVWAECMIHMSRDTTRYASVMDRIVGQVWDSAADITEIPIGVPKAIFPNNERFQRTLRNYVHYHMRTFHDVATQHYIRASQMFHNNIIRTPALMFVSRNDPVGSVTSNDSVRQDWLKLNIECKWKCWDHSEHVSHYIRHKEEYRELLFAHLEMLGFVPPVNEQESKLRAKL